MLDLDRAHRAAAKVDALMVGKPAPMKTYAPDKTSLYNPKDAGNISRIEQGAGVSVTGVENMQPIPLPSSLPPVMPFDADLLPESLQAWVMDIAQRMNCPPDFVAVAAVVSLSSLIGARCTVRPKRKDDWQLVPNLWGAAIGRPGVKKSPALNEAMQPLHMAEALDRERWQEDYKAWQIDAQVAEMAADANKKLAGKEAAKNPTRAREILSQSLDIDPEPQRRRFVVQDFSIEKLHEIISQEVNGWGLLVYRDELHGLLTSLDRQGQEGARGFLLTAYDGNQGYGMERIGRGSVYAERVCLSVLGGIQPAKLQSYVRDACSNGAGDDGLLQRFSLAVWPDIEPSYQHIDSYPDHEAKQAAYAVFTRLAAMPPQPEPWQFDDEAQEIYRQWDVEHQTLIRQEGSEALHPALVSHYAKYAKLVPALALIFALIDTPESQGAIGKNELLRALAWVDYLKAHAERIYSAASRPETSGAHTLLAKIRAGKLSDRDGVLIERFTAREIAIKHWTGLDTPELVRKAAEVLADYCYLERGATAPTIGGGRPSEFYTINPKALEV